MKKSAKSKRTETSRRERRPPKSISFSNRKELIAHLRKGLASGPGKPMTPEDWASIAECAKAKPTKSAHAKTKPFLGQHYEITADREGGLPIPDAMARDMDIQIGDEYAWWKERNGWRIVFLKNAKPGVKIPGHAERRKVEPALSEISAPAKPAKSKSGK